MIIKPKCKKFICVNAHPEGCARKVAEEIAVAKTVHLDDTPRNVLIIGSSNGFGLSTRISAAWSLGANTIGVYSSKPPMERREATAGWYNAHALAAELKNAPGRHFDVNGDAFSPETKDEVLALIRREFPEGLDLVVYSVAAGRRKVDGEIYKSYIRPIGEPVMTLDLDLDTGIVREIELAAASAEDIISTRKVMGGEDWALWIKALAEADLLKADSKSFAFTYIGSRHTRAIYNEGTIGKAKDHLAQTAQELTDQGYTRAQVISQPAVVTQSSSVIPSISLYMTVLLDIYRTTGYDNSTQSHIRRMMETMYLQEQPGHLLINNDYELSAPIQAMVDEKWDRIVAGEPLPESTGDPELFRKEFLSLYGFGRPDIDYDAEIDHLRL